MNANKEITRDLDVCNSLFYAIARLLDDTDGSIDRHALAVLAQEGMSRLENISDLMSR